MSKVLVIPEYIAVMMAEVYNHLHAAVKLSREISADEKCPQGAALTYTHVSSQTKISLDRIEKRIPAVKKEAFENQISNCDPFGFDNVKSMWFKLTADQKETFETAMRYAVSGHEVNLIDDKK